MEGTYYVGKRRHCRKRSHRITLFLGCLVLLTLLLNRLLYPQALALVKSRVTSRISTLSAQGIAEVLAKEGIQYEDLICIRYGTDGKVSSVSVDTVCLTLLKERIALHLLSMLQSKDLSVSLPVGNVTGLLPLSGKLGEISVSVRASESMTAAFHSSFIEAGINQTRHTLSFVFETEVYCLLSGRTEKITLQNTFPAAETVIVGAVPDTFTSISRLTDAVDEYDIDDAVDFGNIIP